MNNINNLISEELGKMSQLFHYQRGTVISEQTTDVGVDVGQMMRQLDAFNTNEDAVLNIIKKYKDNQSFQNFVNQYKKITNKDFGTHLITAISPNTDKKEWNDLSTYLKKNMGITLEAGTTDKGNTSIAIFKGIGSAPKAVTNSGLSAEATACIKQYNGTAPKPAKTPGWVYVIGSNKSTVLFSKDYKFIYRPEGGENTQGQWSCEGNVLKITTTDGDSFANGKWAGVPADKTGDETDGKIVDKPSGKTGNTQKLSALTQDVQKSIGGEPTGKISSQELDLILQRLGGNDVSGEVSQSLPTDGSGKPDLDKILASLSQ